MAALADLQAQRAALVAARSSGARRYRDANGEEVEYKSDSEMRHALAALDAEIAALSGPRSPNVTFTTSKGV